MFLAVSMLTVSVLLFVLLATIDWMVLGTRVFRCLVWASLVSTLVCYVWVVLEVIKEVSQSCNLPT